MSLRGAIATKQSLLRLLRFARNDGEQKMIELTETNFSQEVLNSGTTVVVEFKSEWCPNCKRLTPVLEELEKEFQGKVKFGKADVMANQPLAVKYSVLSVPVTLIFKNGKLVNQLHGFMPKDKLKEVLSEYGKSDK